MENYNMIIGENLKLIRTSRKLSLDKVSSLTGISKSMLSQIEKGTANPSISTVWKLANGFKISFSELVSTTEKEIELIKSSESAFLIESDGKYRNYPIVTFDPIKRFETYKIELDPEAHLNAEPHLNGTVEFVTVMNGSMEIEVNSNVYVLNQGDTLKFKADVKHSYSNNSVNECLVHMILYYPE